MSTFSIFLLLVGKIVISKYPQVAGLASCDFDRFQSGCYSQANLECDLDTNKCRCQIQTPILIENRLCVRRAKANEHCQYSAQCDEEQGFHCYVSPLTSEPIECRPPESQCRCLTDPLIDGGGGGEGSFADIDRDKHPNSGGSHQTAAHHKQALAPAHRPLHGAGAHFHQLQPHQQHKQQQQQHQKQSKNQNHHDDPDRGWSQYSLASILSRFVWILLVVVLIGLITLLVLIKYQSFRTVERPLNPRAEDRVSIELDVPPPYEVAIRMKA